MVQLKFPDQLTSEEFLASYWQQQPLLMRNAIHNFPFPLSPEELAGLACEEEVESRLVIEHGKTPWELKHGPFSEQIFAVLPEDHWTLLVQDVDKYIPEVAELGAAFRFIPDWRADDIMISYAEDGGSVGPHTDTYDVFLVQAEGKRRWQISTADFTDAELMKDLSVRVLKDFKPQQEWTLEPGDVLYLPPGVAHWGIADGPCMTYSRGYRAPSTQEMVDDFSQFLMEQIPDHLHYLDPPLALQRNPAEILPAATELIADKLNQWLGNPKLQQEWFGCFVTQVKEHLPIDPPEETLSEQALKEQIGMGHQLVRHPFARFAFTKASQGTVLLFSCGECFSLREQQLSLVETLCEEQHWDPAALGKIIGDSSNLKLLAQLYNRGYLEFIRDE